MVDILWFVAGGALVWFCKDALIKYWKGAEKFAQDLKAKADAISSAVKK
jgi:hypothetical protein